MPVITRILETALYVDDVEGVDRWSQRTVKRQTANGEP